MPLRKLYANLEEIVGAVLLAALCVIATIQVVGRYILSSPPAWTSELGTILFAWLVFVGASLALKRNEHFAVDVVVEHLPRGPQRAAKALVLLLVAAFCVLLVWFGFRLAIGKWAVTTSVLEISKIWVYAAVPVGAVLMLLRTVEAAIAWWNEPKSPKQDAGSAGGNEQPGAEEAS